MNIYFVGHIGSDAGGWYIDGNGKIHRVPGWNPEAMSELSHAVTILRDASQLKTPGLAEAAIKSVLEFTQGQLNEQVKGGGVVVLG